MAKIYFDTITPKHGPEWEIKYNKLINLDPENNDLNAEEKERVWLGAFTQDILWLGKKDGSMTLDIGWYPDGEPNGSFGIQVLKRTDGTADWHNPLFELDTRSLPFLLEEIWRITNSM